MNEVLEKIQKIGIVPVVVLDDAKDAAPLAKALCEGGLPSVLWQKNSRRCWLAQVLFLQLSRLTVQ